jgi:lipoprotein NlpI
MPRVAFSVFALACLVFAAPAAADNWKDCTQTANRDLAIQGCSAILTRENETPGNRATAYNDRGIAHASKGEVDRAIADYGRALELNPKLAEAYYNRGIAYHGQGEVDRAIADYGRALELNPSYASYNNRGAAYRSKGEYDLAIADYGRALELSPKLAEAYNNRGIAYASKGEVDRAIADYGRALELNPKYAEAYNNRGIAHFVTGDFAKASADLLHVVEVKDAAYPMLFRYLARARLRENAASELEANASRLKAKEWPYAVIELYLGKRQPDAVLAAASKPYEQCQANFFIGEWHILQSRPADAGPLLRKAAETCPKAPIEYSVAQAELKRLKP